MMLSGILYVRLQCDSFVHSASNSNDCSIIGNLTALSCQILFLFSLTAAISRVATDDRIDPLNATQGFQISIHDTLHKLMQSFTHH